MTVRVGLRKYEIVKPDEIVEIGGEMYGKHDPKESRLYIAGKFDQLQQNSTFLHELLHAICTMQDLRDLDQDEHTIELLASGLHMVMVQNPHIFTLEDI